MFPERFILRHLSHLCAPKNGLPLLRHNVSCQLHRFLHSVTTVDREVKKILTIPYSVRYYGIPADSAEAIRGQKGFVKETILRGKAATDIQESILSEFIKETDEASFEQWKSLINKLLELSHGMIHEKNVDGRILEMCYVAKKLPLARNYLDFLKSSGKKFNSVSVCGFLKVCHECQSSMTPEDKQRIQIFTHYLRTKHNVLDSIVGDSIIKGMILCGMGEESFQVLNEAEKMIAFPSSTYAALASYLIKTNQSDRAIEYIRLMIKNKGIHQNVFIDWIEFHKDNRKKLDELLEFFVDVDFKPSKEFCDRLVAIYAKLPRNLYLEGVYGHVNNFGECSVCHKPLIRVSLSEEEFEEMRATFLRNVLVGDDIFQNSTPDELRKFISFVKTNAPFDIVLDGLNVAYMSGTYVTPEVFVGLIRGVVSHFHERDNKICLIGKKHMMNWPNFISTLHEFDVKYFLIDNISEDDLFIIYSTLYSGLDAYFVTRDLFRTEKFELSEIHRSFFKRWQQSHQIFITYVAPSGKVYMKTPISFQMTVQKTPVGGWHIPYIEDRNQTGQIKDEYGIHRKWLCLDRRLC